MGSDQDKTRASAPSAAQSGGGASHNVSRRSFIKAGLAGATGAAVSDHQSAPAAAQPTPVAPPKTGSKLNVIQIIIHDAGQEFGCYAKPVNTPGIDALAAEGVVFANHYCNSTPCSPSRGCLMTGQYAHRNGLIGLVNQGWNIPDHVQTTVDYFNQGGYETVLCGLQHERHWRRGSRPMRYQKRFSTRGHKDPEKRQISAERVAAAARRYLLDRKKGDKPFYLNMGFFEIHAPWNRKCYKPFMPDPQSVELPPFLPDLPVVRQNYAASLGALGFTDQVLSEFCQFLKTSGLEDNTLVIFTTDHGVSFRRAKSSLYEAGMEVALIMKLPGVIKPGLVVDEMTSHIDLLPSTLQACSLAVPDDLDGSSFWGLLTHRQYTPNKYVFTERNFHENFNPMRAVTDGRYKYIRNFSKRPDMPTVKEFEGMDIKHMGDYWSVSSKRPKPLEELYDLANDPHETVNLADSADHQKVRERMTQELYRWMYRTNDFLRGADQPEQIIDMARELKRLSL